MVGGGGGSRRNADVSDITLHGMRTDALYA